MGTEHTPRPGATWGLELIAVEQVMPDVLDGNPPPPARPNRRQRRDAAKAARAAATEQRRALPPAVVRVRIKQVGDALITAVPRGDRPVVKVARIGGRGQR
jgi:hypothetical protein